MSARFLLSLLSRVVPLTIAFLFTFFSDNSGVKLTAYFVGICILIVAELFGVYRPLGNMEELKKKMLEYYFKRFVDSSTFHRKRVEVRINVMLVRWHWFQPHFFQYYQYGMAGHPDANFHFPVSKGFSGKAFEKRTHEIHYVDFRGMSPKEIKTLCDFSQKDYELTADLKAIVCVPLFREVKTFFRGTPHTKFYGVLNVDTVENDGADFLGTEQIQEQITALAGFTQITLN